SSLAYVLLEALRRFGLSGTELARAQVGTIRLRLLKIGAVITRNTRRIRLWLSPASHCNSSFAPAWFTSTGELQRGADPGTRKTMVAVAGCLSMSLLRHHLARFWAKLFAINSSRIPPQPKPPSGAKSGLALPFSAAVFCVACFRAFRE